jgi:hypothetical protein
VAADAVATAAVAAAAEVAAVVVTVSHVPLTAVIQAPQFSAAVIDYSSL